MTAFLSVGELAEVPLPYPDTGSCETFHLGLNWQVRTGISYGWKEETYCFSADLSFH